MANPSELIIKNRSDISQFLIHLTKDGVFDHYVDTGSDRFLWKSQTVNAEDSLRKILTTYPKPRLVAQSPMGYFKYKIDLPTKVRGGVKPEWLKCVCFSEVPLVELPSFYQAVVTKRNEYKKYGLGFWQKTIRLKGGNSVFYIDAGNSSLLTSVNSLIQGPNLKVFQSMLPFIQEFGPRLFAKPGFVQGQVDFRWEREWRVIGSFEFNLSDVAFGICPESQITVFEGIVQNGFPFLDPDWDYETLKKNLVEKKATHLLKGF